MMVEVKPVRSRWSSWKWRRGRVATVRRQGGVSSHSGYRRLPALPASSTAWNSIARQTQQQQRWR